jgi:hypothetical protein
MKKLLNLPYWFAKGKIWFFQSRFPESPWLTESSVLLLDTYLNQDDIGIEWGSGRSTVWFAERVKKLISIESDKQWYDSVNKNLKEKHVEQKVTYFYIPVSIPQNNAPESHPYADVIETGVNDESLDFALVDGKIRITCMEKVIRKIKPGGILILDNAERFIPNKIMKKHATFVDQRERCPNKRWENVLTELQGWREIFTTNNVWDTRLWIKPYPFEK